MSHQSSFVQAAYHYAISKGFATLQWLCLWETHGMDEGVKALPPLPTFVSPISIEWNSLQWNSMQITLISWVLSTRSQKGWQFFYWRESEEDKSPISRMCWERQPAYNEGVLQTTYVWLVLCSLNWSKSGEIEESLSFSRVRLMDVNDTLILSEPF